MGYAQGAPAVSAAEGDAVEPLSDRNFVYLCDFVHGLCGINLTAKKRTMIEGRLRRRMRSLNITNINDYCRFLFEEKPATVESELVHFIDVVTTNKTDFFREPAHFVFMQDRVLPDYLKEGRRRLKIWSAASSTGAEAYTIAMVVDSFFQDCDSVTYNILATDICTEVVEKGIDGLYPDTMLEPIPEEFRRRYVLVPTDANRHDFRISRKLRAHVRFRPMNLIDEQYPFDRDFDLIFLRNVLIYFDRPTQVSVLSKLCDHLRPGGYLFLGHSESITGVKLPLKTVANTIFQRR
jgi:chemotaxis protein methyltransferase CheR